LFWNSEAYKTVFNQVNDAILIHPLQKEGFANFIAVNKAALQKYGYTEEEFLALSPENITKEEDIKIFRTKEYRQELYEAGHKVFETTLYTKAGSEVPVEISSNVVLIEGVPVIVAMIRDITGKKISEEKLNKANENLKATLAAIPDMMFETDIEGRVLDYHIPAHQKPYLDPGILLGIKIQDALPEDVVNIVLKAIGETILKGWSQGATFSLMIRDKMKWFELSISTKLSSKYPSKKFIVLVRDISDRKCMEDNLQDQNRKYHKLNEELSRTLSTLENINSELKKAKLKAEESDKLKTAFLANISHEIRTPMNGIIGFVDLLKSREGLDPKQTKYLSIIEKSSIRLLKIINNIVEIAKIESDNFSVKQEIIDLDMLFSELYQENYSSAKRRGIDLKFKNETDQHEPYIQSDKRAIKKILENLIDNAIKYTFEGEVTYGCQIYNNYIEFYVEDTGEGIRRKDLNIIFDQFSQGVPVFSILNNGVGLGLSIVKAHVSILGGKIWVESELGEGSSFRFTIPLKHFDKTEVKSRKENLTTHKKEKK
jgi:PAS domain S-box-containing protein